MCGASAVTCLWDARPKRMAQASKLRSRRGLGCEKRHFVGVEEARETVVGGNEAIAFGAVGLVANDAVAAAREHRDPRLGGGALDFNGTYGDKAAQDVDDVGARISVCPLQHPTQLAQHDRRHDELVRSLDPPAGSIACASSSHVR
jgi:hypothetical protein